MRHRDHRGDDDKRDDQESGRRECQEHRRRKPNKERDSQPLFEWHDVGSIAEEKQQNQG